MVQDAPPLSQLVKWLSNLPSADVCELVLSSLSLLMFVCRNGPFRHSSRVELKIPFVYPDTHAPTLFHLTQQPVGDLFIYLNIYGYLNAHDQFDSHVGCSFISMEDPFNVVKEYLSQIRVPDFA
jgi:hypothetical protein